MSQLTTVEEVNVIAKRWKSKPGSLIMALHDLQDFHGYVPRAAALELARQMRVPLARIYEVITFYNYFRLKPPGKNTISVCMGTACYLKGAPEIFERTSDHLGIKAGETTADGEYHLQMVRCLGCCGLAPVVTVNGDVKAKVVPKNTVEYICK